MRLVSVQEAAELLRSGELVVVPTETVYGLAARADSAEAILKIYAAKGRPSSHPLIVHCGNAHQAAHMASDWPDLAQRFAERFWPGALTLVVSRGATVCSEATAGGATVGLRVPDHPVFQALLAACGLPLAAPSANRFTKLSPTRVEHLDPELLRHVAGVLDGGPCAVGIESSVVDVTVTPPALLRAGGISIEALRAVAPDIVAASQPSTKSPGQHSAHYQPGKRVKLEPAAGELTIRVEGGPKSVMPNDPAEYARQLYSVLHAMDAAPGDAIVVAEPPNTDAWAAVWDRLRRATASDDV